MHSINHTLTALAVGIGLTLALSNPGAAQSPTPHQSGHTAPKQMADARQLPPLPNKLPAWMSRKTKDHIFYKRGPYNYDIYNIKPLAYDLNAVAVGHAIAYEDMVTGKAKDLDTKTFERINWVLNHPPRLMPDESAISPTFGRKYGELEKVFDWTHILHAQTVDVLASTKLTMEEKDQEIERLWKYYFESVPYAITPLPMNMEYLDSQPYSGAFRKKYPKVNGLFWGYHWLQGAMYDMLYRTTLPQQRASYEVLGDRYHKVELYRTDRYFMPMFADTSPVFAAKYPYIANAFDNLHMLHDMVNDILASDWMSEKEKDIQIKRAIWMVMASTHQGERPGDTSADLLHDHRHTFGMPGMGWMKGNTEELMYMQDMGWMNMADCHHCTLPLPEGGEEGQPASVSVLGWTMRVRCALCARDMSAETQGRTILRIPTEDPNKLLILISDEQGNLKNPDPVLKDVVFLEVEASHSGCNSWSRVFTSRAAFESYVKANEKYADTKPLTLAEWVERQGQKPDTYVKPEGPVENPYVDSTKTAKNSQETPLKESSGQ